MRKITTGDRLRYLFDNTMSRGAVALIGWLAILTIALIVVASIAVVVTGISPMGEEGRPLNVLEVAWVSLMHTMDAGAIGGDSIGSGAFLLPMMIVTLGGIFIFSALIGVLNSGIETKLDDLRKGRSFVVEENHTVVLGWSTQVFAIISELVTANENRPGACIAILAPKDKVEMEEEIRSRIGSMGKTRIVCRTGSPIDLTDLDIVNPNGSRSIIILSAEADDPDSHTIKTILALVNNPERRPNPYHIVAEIRDPQNMEVARMVGRNEVELIPVSDLISRIAVQTCRQSGLSVVYIELLDFGGDEIYFCEERGLVGKTFSEALLAYENSAIIGLCSKDGKVRLNPPKDTRIEAGDAVIAISEDDDTVRLSGLTDYKLDKALIRQPRVVPPQPERTLILGWNRRAPTVVNELDNYVAPGSELMIVADAFNAEAQIKQECAHVKNMKVVFQQQNTTVRRVLDELQVQTYDHVITLSYFDTLSPQEADARTLITLLHLRDISERTGQKFSIVSEMLDIRNRDLAEVTRADDFIVSDKLISLMLSQVSENKALMAVFADLFDPDGAELYFRPAGDYVQTGKAVNFYTVTEAALARGEIAVGCRIDAQSNDAAQKYGVVVNPPKSRMVTFTEKDKIIVLADA